MKALFLDESGDHNLLLIDPKYPLFVLGGIIVDRDYADNAMTQQMAAFKRGLFGNDEIVLHTADITRNRNGFERLKESGFREEFYGKLNELISSLKFQVVACVIRKDAHLARYQSAALDPYLLSLEILAERFCRAIGDVESGGVIVAEKRGSLLDRQLEVAWLNLKIKGTRFLAASDLEKRVTGLNLRDKHANLAGLQLADLVVSPIGRHMLGKPDKEDWRIVESKMRKDRDGNYEGFGLVVLPK